jgi:hypothetical protein
LTPEQYEARLAFQAIEQWRAQSGLADEIENGFVATQGNLATHLLAQAHAQAIDALTAMIDVEPDDPKAVRELQNEVKRFRDLARWMMKASAEGAEAWEAMKQIDQETLAALINPQESEVE